MDLHPENNRQAGLGRAPLHCRSSGGEALGCPHPGSTSHSGENQTISQSHPETLQQAQRASGQLCPGGHQGSGWSQRRQGQGPASPVACPSPSPRGLPAGAPTGLQRLSPASSSGSRDELVLPSRLTLLPAPGAVLRRGARRLRVLLQGLQLGQGDDVAILWPVPHSAGCWRE